jgi:hypothetical protein
MQHVCYTRTFLNVASYLLVYCLFNYQPSLMVGGLGKLLTLLVFASLLTFVVLHSDKIRRMAAAFFEALSLPLFTLPVDPRSIERPLTLAVASRPVLALLFQRPPPISPY